jgi:hypothetical protein
MEEKRNARRFLMRKPEGKRLPLKTRQRWVGNIQIGVMKRDVGVAWADLLTNCVTVIVTRVLLQGAS